VEQAQLIQVVLQLMVKQAVHQLKQDRLRLTIGVAAVAVGLLLLAAQAQLIAQLHL
jgi:hypothetical protein